MKLYDYASSSAAYRVRIALNLKGIAYERVNIDLLKDGGQQHSDMYRSVNPQELIPALETEAGVLAQSLSIIEYLDETHVEPRLLPTHPVLRARVRQFSHVIACDIHPINNLGTRQFLGKMGHSDAEIASTWYPHWIRKGFLALEALVSRSAESGRYCFGDTPTMADICLVPQMANAYRFKVPVDDFPNLVRIDQACRAHPAFAAAAPERQ
ncbi:MAG: maleylacetoacetate isomerase [Alphaproteobacteria bacterium]|jgi:maleylacetoacetate isomerase